MDKMTKNQVFESFKEFYYCDKCNENLLKMKYEKDKIMVSEDFNDYTDSLCKNGLITEELYNDICISDFL